jgi:hypothetical protein
MATVYHAFGYWVSSGFEDVLAPGQAHDWIQWGWGLEYGTANTITAHPLMGDAENVLAVENVRQQTDPNGRRQFFTVRNVGQSDIDGYGIGFSFVND